MAMMHDPDTRAGIERRIQALTPDSRGQWGKMSVDQMLWHCNKAIALSLGEITLGPGAPPIPSWLLKFMVLKLPWMKGAPTHPDFVATTTHDFEAERERMLKLIATATAKPLDSEWTRHPAFGPMTGRQVSTLMLKHLNHHLTQFGV